MLKWMTNACPKHRRATEDHSPGLVIISSESVDKMGSCV